MDPTSAGPSKQGYPDIADVFSLLKSKVDAERLWQRQAQITQVTATVRGKYSGEDGIDQGAIAKEFYTESIRSIGK